MNIKLVDITYFLITFVSQLTLFYVFSKYSKQKLNLNKYFFITIIISSCVESFSSRILPSPINGIVSLLYYLIAYKLFFHLNLKDTIFYSVIIWLIAILIDVSLMGILTIMQNYFINFQIDSPVVKGICTIIQCLLLFLLSKVYFINRFIEKTYMQFKKISYSFIYFIIILLLYIIMETIGIINWSNHLMMFYLIITTAIFTMTIVKFLLYKYDILNLKETNNLLIKNEEFYIKLLNDYRTLKHNLTSKLLGIKMVSGKKVQELIDDLIKDYNTTFLTTSDIKDTPQGLNGLIYEKLYNFNHKELKVIVENNIKSKILECISSRSYNLLCEALGVTLDNAMEASYKSEDKIIYLKFFEDENSITINVINSFSGLIDLDKIGTINYTTKKTGHGIGLYSLFGKKNLSIKTNIKNNLFINIITINKKN